MVVRRDPFRTANFLMGICRGIFGQQIRCHFSKIIKSACKAEGLCMRRPCGNAFFQIRGLKIRELWQQIMHKFTSTLNQYRTEVATQKHANDIHGFMLAEYVVNEPIANSLGVTRYDVEDLFDDMAKDGYSNEKFSTVVYDQDRLVAICLCRVETYKNNEETVQQEIDVDNHDFAEEIFNGPYRQRNANQLFTFLKTLEHREKQLLGTGVKVFKINALCVHSSYRGRGIAKALTRKAIELARSEGCDWVASAVTSFQSEEILRKMQFQTLYEIPFEIFREYGQPVFNHLPDFGDSGKFMALRLKSKN
ncbi:hypothetical protein RB195_012981 [Necator americanus]|uniref:N-acetyltransferase domain-containing protein n=1 Tax=Necator americanus TaxID=51031 RepID=A0ABR1DUW9_NECAM